MDDGDSCSYWDARAVYLVLRPDRTKGQAEMSSIDRVCAELEKYEHPFFEFEARPKGEAVEMIIRSKLRDVLSPEYKITLNDRDLQSSQFPWTFQKLLYDCLTDYVVELFSRNPMTG